MCTRAKIPVRKKQPADSIHFQFLEQPEMALRASNDRLEIMAGSSWEEQGYIPMIGCLTLYLLAFLITYFF